MFIDSCLKASSAASIPVFIALCVPLILGTLTKPAEQPIKTPPGNESFERLDNVSFSGTSHSDGQECHLKLKDDTVPIKFNLPNFDEPAQRYCPAGVYEVLQINETSKSKFQINYQNCVHCKTCDIKDPSQNITWITPQGGEGPNYSTK